MNYVKGLLWGLVLCVVISLLCGCKTKYVAVPEVHTLDSIVTRWRTDSVWQHDSVYIKEYVKGDTVYITKCSTKYKYRDRIMRDTAIVVRRDSVQLVSPQTQTEYRTHWYDAVCRRIAAALLIFLATAIVALLVKRKS